MDIFYHTEKKPLVSRSKTSGHQVISEVEFSAKELCTGTQVKLSKVPFLIKIFKIVSPDGNDYVITNDLTNTMNIFQVELKKEIGGQVEDFYRSYKQLTGSEKCQCRKTNSQRNHFACRYPLLERAWVAMKVYVKNTKNSIYQAKYQLLEKYLIVQIKNPTIQAI